MDFDFQIGNSKYSKGTYRLSRQNQVVLILQNLDESETKILFGTHASGSSVYNSKSTLVFNKYGDRHFLRKVISPVMNAKIGLSKDEKNVRRNAQEKLAKIKVEKND